ncbi:hypothetical protein Pcinc_037663 [Petrolisthes cinctipes]|uniref:Uncharacterized protein n=1 Tax=Petrolisthes cinctipes TaxID=88211 RepID=A0AAE1BTJ8_PETCI|nr:hypothetical protein Pcinc_037663 [Petrolisthes cinctipes]
MAASSGTWTGKRKAGSINQDGVGVVDKYKVVKPSGCAKGRRTFSTILLYLYVIHYTHCDLAALPQCEACSLPVLAEMLSTIPSFREFSSTRNLQTFIVDHCVHPSFHLQQQYKHHKLLAAEKTSARTALEASQVDRSEKDFGMNHP